MICFLLLYKKAITIYQIRYLSAWVNYKNTVTIYHGNARLIQKFVEDFEVQPKGIVPIHEQAKLLVNIMFVSSHDAWRVLIDTFTINKLYS